jgi:peptide/nickel transport system substrate-binding protein
VTFSDGTPLDAAAVVASIKRHIENTSRFAPVVANIEDYATPDERTVVFTLTEPWPGFPYVLSTSPGMITSPTALNNVGDDQFGAEPVGAGPFTVQRYAPGEVLELKARDDYWNGRPHLDEVHFLPILGGQAQFDALRAGDLQVAFLRQAAPIAAAREAGFPGYRNNLGLGTTWLINNGVRGQDRPTADVRVRQAIAHAIDLDVLNERADEGKAIVSRDVMPASSPYHDEESTITYDPDRATALLDEVKAETGWDGSLTVSCTADPAGATRADTTVAMLNAVGFEATSDPAPTIADLISKVGVDADYDLACWGMNVDDSNPYEAFSLHLGAESPANFSGYTSEELEGFIHDLKVAGEPDEITATLNGIQALFDRDVPVAIVGPAAEFVAWDPSVHGIRPSVKTMVLLDEAFIADE